jgi:hypothetical protein
MINPATIQWVPSVTIIAGTLMFGTIWEAVAAVPVAISDCPQVRTFLKKVGVSACKRAHAVLKKLAIFIGFLVTGF